MSIESINGACLCGAVKLTTTPPHREVDACHCAMCRSWGGGPFMTIHAGRDLVITGEDNITRFDSSDWGARCFCKTCGSHLFYHLKGKNEYFLSAGLFDASRDYKFVREIFIDSKPGNYDFSNDTQKRTGAEVFGSAD